MRNVGLISRGGATDLPLLSGTISIVELVTKEEWNGEEAQAGRHRGQHAGLGRFLPAICLLRVMIAVFGPGYSGESIGARIAMCWRDYKAFC